MSLQRASPTLPEKKTTVEPPKHLLSDLFGGLSRMYGLVVGQKTMGDTLHALSASVGFWASKVILIAQQGFLRRGLKA